MRKPVIRFAAAVFGGLAATAALLAILIVLNADGAGTRPFGWTIPLLTGLMVGVVAWALLVDAPEVEEPVISESTCGTCGRNILSDWRICPYCGTLVSRLVEANVTDLPSAESSRVRA
jgi:hypothetical protein